MSNKLGEFAEGSGTLLHPELFNSIIFILRGLYWYFCLEFRQGFFFVLFFYMNSSSETEMVKKQIISMLIWMHVVIQPILSQAPQHQSLNGALSCFTPSIRSVVFLVFKKQNAMENLKYTYAFLGFQVLLLTSLCEVRVLHFSGCSYGCFCTSLLNGSLVKVSSNTCF